MRDKWVVRIRSGESCEDRSILLAYGFSGPNAESLARAFAKASGEKFFDITALLEMDSEREGS